MSTAIDADTDQIPVSGVRPSTAPQPRHGAPEVPPTQPPAQGGFGSTALVLCALILGIAVVCVALAIAGDPTSAAMIAFTSILLGFVAACVFSRRWR